MATRGKLLQLTETIPPAGEPVSLQEIKAHCRCDFDDEDILLHGLGIQARQEFEGMTGRHLVDRTSRLDLPCFDREILMPVGPLIEVVSIKYSDSDDQEQTLAASTYEVDLRGGRILLASGQAWPAVFSRHDAVRISIRTGTAGTGSPPNYWPVDERWKSAMYLAIDDLWNNRSRASLVDLKENPAWMRLVNQARISL